MKHTKKGFTLIELLTVVLILGVLTAVALPQYRKAIYRAEAANALVGLKSLYDSAKRSYAMHSVFPTSFAELDVKLESDTTPGATLSSGGFTYSFYGTKGMQVCRSTNTQTNSLCLRVSYLTNSGKRDEFTCVGSGKYASVCESMCPTPGAECVIE